MLFKSGFVFSPRLQRMTIAVLMAGGTPVAEAQTSSLTTLPPSFRAFSEAVAVSSDGTVVVGTNVSVLLLPPLLPDAFRWTQSGGTVFLGGLGGLRDKSSATGVSGNGTVVVGSAQDGVGGNSRAYRWTQAAGMTSLGVLNGYRASFATGISGDGTVVVGYSSGLEASLLDVSRAFRWTQAGGMVDLGVLNGSSRSSAATGVSGNGTVVVGNANDGAAGDANRAFRWTQTGGMVSLGVLNGGTDVFANGVSGDGTVVVGIASDGALANANRAFRWTQAGGMTNLGVLNGSILSNAKGVSSDGAVVVGFVSNGASVDRAFRWTQGTGMQSVANWLRSAGVTVAAESALRSANATNSDGSVVVGTGFAGAFIARVAPSGNGMITLADVSQSLGSASQAGNMLLSSNNLLMDGAHSRPLARRAEPGKRTFWVSGDVGRDDHGMRDGLTGLAEVGLGYNTGPVQINGAVGNTWARQNMSVGGRVKAESTYVMAEALLPLGATRDGGLWAVVGGYGYWGEADIRRGYLNAGTPDSSAAQPDTKTWALRARLEWDNAFKLGGAAFSPYVGASYARTRLDGYTEIGGGFPARFDARNEKSTELRLGANVAWPLGLVQLIGMLEHVHRFERTGTVTSGQMVGLFGFSLPGQTYKRDWERAGVGVEGKLGGGVASLMLNATTRGEAPNAWLAASWRMVF